MKPQMSIQLGLKENWGQFSLLILVNAFVGAMVGLERSLLPQIAEKEFGLVARDTRALSSNSCNKLELDSLGERVFRH